MRVPVVPAQPAGSHHVTVSVCVFDTAQPHSPKMKRTLQLDTDVSANIMWLFVFEEDIREKWTLKLLAGIDL